MEKDTNNQISINEHRKLMDETHQAQKTQLLLPQKLKLPKTK